MKKVLIAMLALLVQQLHSQNFTDKSFFVLTGKVENASIEFFELTTTGFWNNTVSRVSLSEDGSFHLNKTFEGKQQTIYCYLNNDVITFTVRNGDTLVLSWDEADFQNSFTAKSPQSLTDAIVRLQRWQYLNFQKNFREIQRKYFEQRSIRDDSSLQTSIHALFKKELALLAEGAGDSEAIFQSLYTDLYFRYAKILSGSPVVNIADLKPGLEKIISSVHAEKANTDQFLTSYNYRIFLLNNVRLPGIDFLDDQGGGGEVIPVSKLLVKSVMSNPFIQDWHIVSYVRSRENPFNQKKAGDIYKKVAPRITSAQMLEKLDEHLLSFTKANPGSRGPVFTLKDSLGEDQSLSDWRGRVVYIDFWGVGCVPCIHDIVNNSPSIHERYKDREVAFISICVDADETEWKAALKKHNMTGSINLIAKDWLNHPVVQQYSASSLPTYIIVGKDGRVFDNHAPTMGELLKERSNIIDRALMVYDEY